MARMTITGMDDLDKMFEDLSSVKVKEIAIKAVNDAVPILEESMKSAIASAANKGYSTGELAASVSSIPAKENEYGVFSVVKPMGTHSGGEPNTKLAAILEYGRHGGYRKHLHTVTTQAPSPFRAKAVSMARAKCEEIMRQTVEKELSD